MLVKGSGFDPKIQVVFDLTPVNVKFVSEKEVTCIAPPHPEGIVDLSISKNGSCYSNKVVELLEI